MKIITRLNVLVVSIAGLIVAGYLYSFYPSSFNDGRCLAIEIRCKALLWTEGFAVLIPIFIFSLITYKMKDKVFKPWAWLSIFFAGIYI